MASTDFSDLSGVLPITPVKGGTQGEKRPWLKVFETPPAQLLNAYGRAKYTKTPDKDMWVHMSQPLKSGAAYMSELCSDQAERRGIGLNRWLHAMVSYCQYQKTSEARSQNQFIMKEALLNEVYDEIDRILPSLEYCLAPKKVAEKTGASALRAAEGSVVSDTASGKDPALLDKHAKILYDWVQPDAVSRIRMLATWQASGGQPFVASVYHRATQCFKVYGNHCHAASGDGVTLEEFQQSIKIRHSIGNSGIEARSTESSTIRDFA